jgi:hypothetical protein
MLTEVKTKEGLEKGETMEVIEETNLERAEEQNEGGEREEEVYVIPIKTLYKKTKTLEESLTNTLSDFGLKQEQLLEMVKEKLNNIKYNARYEDNSDLEIARNRLLFMDRIKNDIEKLDKLAKNKITYELMGFLGFPFTSKDLDDLYYNVFIPFSTAKDAYYKIEEEIESIKQEVKRLEGEINQKIESKIAELREEINQLKEDLSKDKAPEDDRVAKLQEEFYELQSLFSKIQNKDDYSKRISEIEEEISQFKDELMREVSRIVRSEIERIGNKDSIEEEISQFKDELMREVSRIVRSEIERIGNKDSSGINIEEIQTIVEGIIEKKISDLKLVKDNQQQEEGKEEETNMKRVMDQERESDKKKDIIQTLKENPKWILIIIAVLAAIGVFLGNRL